MYANDPETLRRFATALELSPKLFDPPQSGPLRAAQIAIAQCFCEDWSGFRFGETLREHAYGYEPGQGYVPLFLLLDSVRRHAFMTVNYAVYHLLKEGYLEGLMIHASDELLVLDEWMTFEERFDATNSWHVVPLVRSAPSLRLFMVAGDREAGRRDHLWLEWKFRENLTPAPIRDRWNRMSNFERTVVSPNASYKIADGEHGIDTVKQALRKAKAELKEVGMSVEEFYCK